MRILFMADVLPNRDSGAAGTELATIRALRAQGHEVTEIWGDRLNHRIRHGNLHYLLELPREYRRVMLSELAKARYDVVHVNQPHGYLAAKALRESGARTVFVHRSHGFEPHIDEVVQRWSVVGRRPGQMSARNRARRLMRRLLERNYRGIARWADGHIVSASACAQYLRDRYGVSEARVSVIPQAAPDRYRESPPPAWNPERGRRLLYVGQFAFVKAPHVTAAVVNRLLRALPELTMTWVTGDAFVSEVESMIEAEIRDRVCIRGWVSQEELIGVYDEHGVFLFPSFAEGFGKAFLEAMARGLCVVASDAGGAHDVVRPEVDGILVPVGSTEAMVQAVVGLLRDPGAMRLMSERAVVRAREFSWERVARETVDAYARWIESASEKG